MAVVDAVDLVIPVDNRTLRYADGVPFILLRPNKGATSEVREVVRAAQ